MTLRIATVTLNPAIDQTAAIPNFTPDAVNRVTWEQADPGGKGVNVASFLADYGHAVSVTGFLGQDNLELFQRLFQQKGIADHFVHIAGKTRVNIKIVDDLRQQVTDINFPGMTPTEADVQRLWQVIEHLTPAHDWFVLAGSVPQGFSATIYQQLVTSLRAAGRHVALDTSGESLRQAIAAQPDLIKPNRLELQEVVATRLDNEADIVDAARVLIQGGIQTVVVSMGADGALFVNAHQAIHAQPPPVEVKSTVGAGDAMVAGTVAGLVRGLSLADCARLGTAFSMGALSQVGPRLPPMADIRANGDRVVIRSLT